MYNFSPSALKMWIFDIIRFRLSDYQNEYFENQGFCPSKARQNLTIAPIDLNFW